MTRGPLYFFISVAVKNVLQKAGYRYLANIHVACAYGIMTIMMYAFYRVRVYFYIQELHPGAKLDGFREFTALSFHYDSVAVFFSLMAIVLILVVLGGAERTKHAVLHIYSVLFIFFVLFSMEFFRVYETAFQKNFAGKEHFSGLGGVVHSAVAEFSPEFYILFFTLMPLSILMGAVLRRFETYKDIGLIMDPHRLPRRMAAALFIPALLCFFMLSGALTSPGISAGGFEGRYKQEDEKKYIRMLHEFSMNPVYNLFSGSPASGAHIAEKMHSRGAFSFGLNTDSITADFRHGSIDIIPRSKKYNIILYFFESTPSKYYDLKAGGKYLLGTWRRLEQNSINFRNHYANYPLSANALMTVFTSAYDMNSKDMVIQKYPDIGLRTMPEILKERGYMTCLIHTGGLGYAGQKRFLKKRKFDEITDYNQLVEIPPYNNQVGWGVDERAMIRPAVEFMRRHRGSPRFLVLMPVNPHHPYAIPDDTFRITGQPPVDPHDKKRHWHNYCNSLYYSDACLGMLVDELERAGVMDDTLLFLFADHGEAFYQHRMNYNHPLFLYDENVHVPFLIYNRKLFASPEYFDGISRHIDILPTVLDILGIPGSPEQEGVRLLSPHREQMALLHTSWKDDYMGVVDRRWKYICRTEDGAEEMYDMARDPDEQKNIVLEQPDLAGRYRSFVAGARQYKDEYYRRVLGMKSARDTRHATAGKKPPRGNAGLRKATSP